MFSAPTKPLVWSGAPQDPKSWHAQLRDAASDDTTELAKQLLARRVVEDELDRIARETRRG